MNIIILTTGGGNRFARKIALSIEWIDNNKFNGELGINTHIESVFNIGRLFNSNNFEPNNTIIHARAAHPRCTWIEQLAEMEQSDFKVINSTNVLKLTSNKLACSLRLQDSFPHPRTWEINKRNFSMPELEGEYILKPETSISQGSMVRKIVLPMPVSSFMEEINQIPGNRVVLQEFINYTSLNRAIVINGKALPFLFVDKPTPERWKVSTCLNKISMEFIPVTGENYILKLSEEIQKYIGGEINFIDIFDTINGPIISEINTACSLNIHEGLAHEYGHPQWNIHFKIAKYLVDQLLEIIK